MRSALALKMLLLLLLPPPSLSEKETADQSGLQPAAPSTARPSTVFPTKPTDKAAAVTSTPPSTTASPEPSVQSTALSAVPRGKAGPATSTLSVLPGGTSTSSAKQELDDPAGPVGGSQGVSTTRPTFSPASKDTQTTSFQTGDKAAAVPGDHSSSHATTQLTTRADLLSPHSTVLVSTDFTSTVSYANPASPHQPSTVTLKSSESSLEGQHSPTVVPSSSSSVTGTGSPTVKGVPNVQTSPLSIMTSTDSPQGTPQSSSQMTPSPTAPSSTASWSSSSSGAVATSAAGGHTSSSPDLASTGPQSLSTSSSTLVPGNVMVDCMPPEKPDEKMLILNLTETSPCAKGPLADDKLVSQLCRAVKATFNPAQDSCTVQLAPIRESQAVAIKKITIQTNLLPENMYELLKDKWDDLREVGVSHMQLGDEGPPEEAEDRFSMPLIITIVCLASFLLLVAALYGCCHQRLSQRKDQQRLTEELQTVENGYHDNPTLEVMETSSEMQEKKVVNLNGELGDSWIVPLDNLTKDDLDEEEDTHL